jgi:hypothetical protein
MPYLFFDKGNLAEIKISKKMREPVIIYQDLINLDVGDKFV